ncbi:MAG: hypothetical protein ACRDWY_05315 [Actinomycetes bacterium]
MRVTRESAVGGAASLAGIVAMASDHLAHGADDWPAFAISVVVIVVTAWLVFGVVVRRPLGDGRAGARRAGACAQRDRVGLDVGSCPQRRTR